MEKLNKKGFTLVELLSVIVILSVVVLIATNAVVPMMGSAKKQVFATEANEIIKHAWNLYGKNGSGTKCYSYQEILEGGTLSKNDENYNGSVLIENNDGKMTYRIWLSNGTNLIDGKEADISPDDVTESGEEASTVCGKQ